MKAVTIGFAAALICTAGLAAPLRAPEIRAETWLNGTPPGDLRGRVVLVEFWTFG